MLDAYKDWHQKEMLTLHDAIPGTFVLPASSISGIHSERETLSSNIKSITATFSLPPFSLSLSSPLSLHLSSRRVLPLGRFIFILGSDELEQT